MMRLLDRALALIGLQRLEKSAAEAEMVHFTVNAFDGESVGAFLKQYGKPVKLPPGGGGGGVRD